MSNIQALEGKLLFGDDRFDLANRNTHLNEGDANEALYKAGIGLDSARILLTLIDFGLKIVIWIGKSKIVNLFFYRWRQYYLFRNLFIRV